MANDFFSFSVSVSINKMNKILTTFVSYGISSNFITGSILVKLFSFESAVLEYKNKLY